LPLERITSAAQEIGGLTGRRGRRLGGLDFLTQLLLKCPVLLGCLVLPRLEFLHLLASSANTTDARYALAAGASQVGSATSPASGSRYSVSRPQVSPDPLDGWPLALGYQLVGRGMNVRFSDAAGHAKSP